MVDVSVWWCGEGGSGPMSDEVKRRGDGGEDRSIVNVALISAVTALAWL
jgi:hypothetical protein